MACEPLVESNPIIETVVAGLLIALLVGFLFAVYVDLGRHERENPRNKYRGPFPVRYCKHLFGFLLDGLPGAF